MDNVVARQYGPRFGVRIGDYAFATESIYGPELAKTSQEAFLSLVDEGKVSGSYFAETWKLLDDPDWTEMTWHINSEKYALYGEKCIHKSLAECDKILRCYFMYCYGELINSTISQIKVGSVVRFLENYGTKDYKATKQEKFDIGEFLSFISVDEDAVDLILSSIKEIPGKKYPKNRKLKRPINYLAVADAVKHLYSSQIDDETFVKWFPVWYWVSVGFVLPQRATEILLTPLKCIIRVGERVQLLIRRSLKKKGWRVVHCDVDKDYRLEEHSVPDNNSVRIIEKYISLTADTDRRFLFLYGKYSLNKFFSLERFNLLIRDFMDKFVMHNPKYGFAKDILGIQDFDYITAGDSRPIAIANAFYYCENLDTCRQLAGQEKVDVTNGYFVSGSELFEDTSIIEYINFIDEKRQNIGNKLEKSFEVSKALGEGCQLETPNYKTDCEGFDNDCMGCKHYSYTLEELEEYYKTNQEEFEKVSQELIYYLSHKNKVAKDKINLEELRMKQSKYRARYKIALDKRNGVYYAEWERSKFI